MCKSFFVPNLLLWRCRTSVWRPSRANCFIYCSCFFYLLSCLYLLLLSFFSCRLHLIGPFNCIELLPTNNILHILGVVTTLPQRLLFTSEVHVACCDMHNRSGAAPVLRGWGGSNFLFQRWKFNLQGSASKVFSLRAFVVSPASASFHSSCQFLLHFQGHVHFVVVQTLLRWRRSDLLLASALKVLRSYSCTPFMFEVVSSCCASLLLYKTS